MKKENIISIISILFCITCILSETRANDVLPGSMIFKDKTELVLIQQSEPVDEGDVPEERLPLNQEKKPERKPQKKRVAPKPDMEAEVDLAVTEVQINNREPRIGDRITVTARVRNSGNHAVSRVVVLFLLNDKPIGKRFITISPRGMANARVEIELHADGPNHIFVMVDPENGVREFNEGNNMGEVSFFVAGIPEDSDRSKEPPKKIGPPAPMNLQPGQDAITVIVPTLDQKLYIGSSIEIQWSATGTFIDDKVGIKLWEHSSPGIKGGTDIIKSTPNDGKYTWKVPPRAPGKYTIEITTLDEKVSDESDSFFIKFNKATNITILSPQKGTKMWAGSTFAIKWAAAGQHDPKSHARIDIRHQDTGMLYTIGVTGMTSGMPTITGSVFNWQVTMNAAGQGGLPSGKYTLEISNLDNGIIGKSGVFEIISYKIAKSPSDKNYDVMEKAIPPGQASNIKVIGTYKADIAIGDAGFFGSTFNIVIINKGPEIVPSHLVPKIKVTTEFNKNYICTYCLSPVSFQFGLNVGIGAGDFSATVCPAGWYPSGIKFKVAKVSLQLPPEIIDPNSANNTFLSPYPTKDPWIP